MLQYWGLFYFEQQNLQTKYKLPQYVLGWINKLWCVKFTLLWNLVLGYLVPFYSDKLKIVLMECVQRSADINPNLSPLMFYSDEEIGKANPTFKYKLPLGKLLPE